MNRSEWGNENVEVAGVDNLLEVCCEGEQGQGTWAGMERHVEENNKGQSTRATGEGNFC